MAVGNYMIKQISSIVNDAYEDITGQSNSIQTLDTTALVSMGATLDNMGLLEGWFGKLANRIVKTVFFVRTAPDRRERSILRDEHEYGAFVQKIYATAPDVVDNSEYKIPNSSTGLYTQSSPYDVNATIEMDAKVFGGQGTFSIEFVKPVDQIRTAFLNGVDMQRMIDAMYTAAMNKLKIAMTSLVDMACNTGIAACLNNDLARNLLYEYNTLHADDVGFTALTVANCLSDADFCRYCTMEIKETIDDMQEVSTVYNAQAYETFTDEENLVLEMLSKAMSYFEVYLQADTFHDDLVKLPGFEKVSKWQMRNKDVKPDFESLSTISVIHDEFKDEVTNPTGKIEQSGIIAFLHDKEYVAAYFGHERDWEHYNPRDDVYSVGFPRRKGYAIDDHANAMVFYIADPVTP